jgi:hypothetical protein
MNINWNCRQTPVSAFIADRKVCENNWTVFRLVLSFRTNASNDSVVEFVARSLLANGIRHWDDDNNIPNLTNDGLPVVFSVSGCPLMVSDLANKVSITRDGGVVRVSIPCGGN